MGHKTKWEYFRALYERYRKAGREAKRVMLNEFCWNTGYNRKYAIRLVNGPAAGKPAGRRPRRRRPRYGRPGLSILAADLGSGRISLVGAAEGLVARLDALDWQALPDAPGDRETAVGHERTANRPAPEGEQQRAERKRRRYGRTKPGSRLQHPIPVKSDRWDVNSPGFSEIDRVSHSGNSGEGEFAHSLNLTDIHSGWTESRALLGKSQVAVQQALDEIEKGLRFPLPGVDLDDGSEFINWHLQSWCEPKTIQLTRGRPYQKDDKAHLEQKNWTPVRKLPTGEGD